MIILALTVHYCVYRRLTLVPVLNFSIEFSISLYHIILRFILILFFIFSLNCQVICFLRVFQLKFWNDFSLLLRVLHDLSLILVLTNMFVYFAVYIQCPAMFLDIFLKRCTFLFNNSIATVFRICRTNIKVPQNHD